MEYGYKNYQRNGRPDRKHKINKRCWLFTIICHICKGIKYFITTTLSF